MSDLKDIWMRNEGRLPEDMLIAYMEGKLPPDQQRQVEQWLADEGMESDALEGLQDMNTTDAQQMVSRLNHNLHKSLAGKQRKRRQLVDNRWGVVAIVVIVLLAVLAYYVIYLSAK